MMSVNYEELVQSISIEHNKIREDPQSYIPLLEEQMKYFKGNIMRIPGRVGIQTNEGISAYEEAVEFLKKQQRINYLTLDQRLSKAAEYHANDIGPKGLLGHDSSDGKTLSDRIGMYCEWEYTCGENIDFGAQTGQDVIISLLVDDGVQSRGHRKNIFKTDFNILGIGCGPHKEYGIISVIDYVGGLRDKSNNENPKEKLSSNTKNIVTNNTNQVLTNNSQQIVSNKNNTNKTSNPKSDLFDDEDTPEGTVSINISKSTQIKNGKKTTKTKKIFTLKDGSQHIVEIEEH